MGVRLAVADQTSVAVGSDARFGCGSALEQARAGGDSVVKPPTLAAEAMGTEGGHKNQQNKRTCKPIGRY